MEQALQLQALTAHPREVSNANSLHSRDGGGRGRAACRVARRTLHSAATRGSRLTEGRAESAASLETDRPRSFSRTVKVSLIVLSHLDRDLAAAARGVAFPRHLAVSVGQRGLQQCSVDSFSLMVFSRRSQPRPRSHDPKKRATDRPPPHVIEPGPGRESQWKRRGTAMGAAHSLSQDSTYRRPKDARPLQTGQARPGSLPYEGNVCELVSVAAVSV